MPTFKNNFLKISQSASASIINSAKLLSFFKDALVFGNCGFELLGFSIALQKLKELWAQGGKEHSFGTKVGLSTIHLAHIGLAIIGGLTTLGVSILAAPIATVMVSCVAFVSNTSEVIAETGQISKLKQKLKALNEELDKDNVAFERNKALFEDVCDSQEKIRELEIQKGFLIQQISALNDESNLDTIEKNPTKHEMIIDYFNNFEKLKHTITLLKSQIENLDSKYNAAPYFGKRSDLKILEKEYLIERIKTLNSTIEDWQNIDIRLRKIEALSNQKKGLLHLGDHPSKNQYLELHQAFKKTLLSELNEVNTTLNQKQEVLNKKKMYIPLFIKNPLQQLKQDTGKIFKTTLDIVDTKIKTTLTTRERNNNIKNAFFTGLISGLAISSFVPPLWPLAGVLGAVALGMGIVAGVSELWHLYQKKKLQNSLQKEKDKKLSNIIKHLDTQLKESLDEQDEEGDKAIAALVKVEDQLASPLLDTEKQVEIVKPSKTQEIIKPIYKQEKPTLKHSLKRKKTVKKSEKVDPNPDPSDHKPTLH